DHLQISAAQTAASIVLSWMDGKMASHTARARTKEHKPFYTSFGFQVLVAMVIGLVLGFIAREMGNTPEGAPNWLAQTLQTVGTIFVQLLRALVPPLIFT